MATRDIADSGVDNASIGPVLGGKRAWIIWLIATFYVVWLFTTQTGYAILNSRIAGELKLSIDQIGMIAATYTWVFAITQLFSGPLLDKLGSRKVLLPAMTLFSCGVFLLATAQNYPMLLLSQVIMAVGSCAGFVGAGYVGGVWFGLARFGFMFGLVSLVTALSSAAGQVGFDVVLAALTWRQLMLSFGGFGLGLLALALIFMRNPVEPESSGLSVTSFACGVFCSIGQVLKNPQVILIALFGSVSFGTMLALGVVWAPKLVIAHGVDESSANTASAALWLGLAVGSLVINKLTDLCRARKIPAIGSLMLQLVTILALIYLPMTGHLAQLLCFLFGIGASGNMLAFTMAADNVAPHLIGTSASVVNSAEFIVGGLLMDLPAQMLAGTKGDLPAFQHAMLMMAGLLIVSIILAAITRECYPKKV